MAYIGRQLGQGVRNRFIYTATAGQTTFSGSDDNGGTLVYTDGTYVDVNLNGVELVSGTDYTATSGTSIVLTTGASLNDTLSITVYDVFAVADTVSAQNGGTFSGDVVIDGTFTSQGIDDNATSTAMTLDSSGNVGIGLSSGISSKLHVNTEMSIGADGDNRAIVGYTPDRFYIGTRQSGTNYFDTVSVSSGNVGIGTVPSGLLTSGYVLRLDGGGQTYIAFNNDTYTTQVLGGFVIGNDSGAARITQRENQSIIFATNNTDRMAISGSGNVSITGALSKGSGSFKIDHPIKEETHHLVHSFVEGPQADLIYRGKVALVNGTATVNIDTVAGMTEGTFDALNREVQCFTSNESGWTAVRGSVLGNILTIEAQDNTCTDKISWMVVGERKDQHMYDTEWTDENGKVIVEPEKVIEDLEARVTALETP